MYFSDDNIFQHLSPPHSQMVVATPQVFMDKPLDLGDPLTVWIVGHLRDIPIFRPMIRLACGCMFGLADWCLYFNEPWSLWLSDMGCLRTKMTILHSRDKEVSKHWILGFTKNYGEPATHGRTWSSENRWKQWGFHLPRGKRWRWDKLPMPSRLRHPMRSILTSNMEHSYTGNIYALNWEVDWVELELVGAGSLQWISSGLKRGFRWGWGIAESVASVWVFKWFVWK